MGRAKKRRRAERRAIPRHSTDSRPGRSRCAALKRQLVQFATRAPDPLLVEARRAFVAGRRSRPRNAESDELHVDPWIHETRLPDGRSILDRFIEVHADRLTAAERALVNSWKDYRIQVYEVLGGASDHLRLRGLEDRLEYRVESNMGLHVMTRYPRNGFLLTAIVPWGDRWLLSGVSMPMDHSLRDQVMEMVVERIMANPDGFLRNPAHRAQALEHQRAMRASFIAEFGRDDVVVGGADAAATVDRAYAAHNRRMGGDEPMPPSALPEDLTTARTVGVICDPDDGLLLCVEYADFLAPFEDRAASVERVGEYLRAPSVSPTVFRRVAARFPERIDAVMRAVLDRDDFVWTRDGEALLAQHRPKWRPKPSVTGFEPEYVAAIRRLVPPTDDGHRSPPG